MDRLKSIFLYLIFSCPFLLMAAENSIYKNYSHLNYRKTQEFQNIIDLKNINYQILNASIFFRTNEIRVKYGLNVLAYHKSLELSASMHARDMCSGGFFSHINPTKSDRKNPSDRFRLCGITNPMAAENIANSFAIKYKSNSKVYIIDKEAMLYSYSPEGKPIEPHSYISFADRLLEQWLNSKGHRENILRATAIELGCAAVFFRENELAIPKFMCVQNFQLYESVVL